MRETIGKAVARARGLPRKDHPLTRQELVRDIHDKAKQPPSIEREWKARHGLDN